MKLPDMMEALAAGLSNAAVKPNIHSYEPNEGGQTRFHHSKATGRLLAGSNRSGKTVAGAVEAIWRATGRHPYLRVPEPPIFGRIITVDFDYGADQIIEPQLAQWIPPSELVNGSWEDSYNRKKHLLKLRNGSKIEIKAHGQDLLSFAGTPRHFLWVDEECPKTIFIESKARLLDYNGKYWITLTSIEGSHTWVFEDLVEGDTQNVEVFHIDIRDNRSIDPASIDVLSSDLDEEERQIRIEGKFIPRGGLVYKNFDYDRNVIEAGMPPEDWIIWASLDPGFNNPTAWLWHAVSPFSPMVIVTFAEHYRREWTAAMHAQKVLEMEAIFPRAIFLRVADPDMLKRNNQTGHSLQLEYMKHGVNIKPATKLKDNAEIDRQNEYLRLRRWLITKNCPNLIREIRKLPWKRYQSPKIADLNNRREEPLAKDNHATDSSGYFFSFVPDLSKGTPYNDGNPISLTRTNPQDYPWRVDPGVFAPVSRSQQMQDLGWGEVP